MWNFWSGTRCIWALQGAPTVSGSSASYVGTLIWMRFSEKRAFGINFNHKIELCYGFRGAFHRTCAALSVPSFTC